MIVKVNDFDLCWPKQANSLLTYNTSEKINKIKPQLTWHSASRFFGLPVASFYILDHNPSYPFATPLSQVPSFGVFAANMVVWNLRGGEASRECCLDETEQEDANANHKRGCWIEFNCSRSFPPKTAENPDFVYICVRSFPPKIPTNLVD
ncbi:hypothetical protein LguiB_035063 [Lonicera macranthoides]